jgi:hypothetical protein
MATSEGDNIKEVRTGIVMGCLGGITSVMAFLYLFLRPLQQPSQSVYANCPSVNLVVSYPMHSA